MKFIWARIIGLVVLGLTIVSFIGCGDDDEVVVGPSGGVDSAFFTFGGSQSDAARSVARANDGGYIVVGETSSYGDNSKDVFLVKFASNGYIQWQKNIGGFGDQTGNGVAVLSDGYAIVGTTYDGIQLTRTDTEGEVLWTETYSGQEGLGIQNAPGGGWVLSGVADGIVLIKTDAVGHEAWRYAYNVYPDQEYGRSVACTPDGGYVVCGDGYTDLDNGFDLQIIKVSATGDLVWAKRIGGTGNDWGNSVICLTDGSIVLTGYAPSLDGQTNTPFLRKLDSSGELVWEQAITGLQGEGYGVIALGDGGFAVIGESISENNDVDLSLARTNASGAVQWIKTFGGDESDRGRSLVATAAGGFALAGFGSSYGAGDNDGYLFITDGSGVILK